jgi:hypothetical protein
MSPKLGVVCALGAALSLQAGCDGGHKPANGWFTQSMVLGGETYTADQLNSGFLDYTEYCRPCHGDKGDGKGLSSYALWPVPRNFTQGQFEFGSVTPGDLPTDDDFKRIVRNGLQGTGMLPWDVPDDELSNIIGYIKTFSPRWQTEKPSASIVIPPDPWAGKDENDAIHHGEEIYVKMGCNGCHPTFVTKERFYEIQKAAGTYDGLDPSVAQSLVDGVLYTSTPKPSEVFGEILVPPDFTRDPIRSATGHVGPDGKIVSDPTDQYQDLYKVGAAWFIEPTVAIATPQDVYRIVANGLNGAAMPSFVGAMTDEDFFALAHYIVHLSTLRDTQEGFALHESLENQAPFEVPAPPASTPASGPASGPTGQTGANKANAPAAPHNDPHNNNDKEGSKQ